MPESTALNGDLESALRSYFAVTTSTELPRRVGEMSARTLGSRRRPFAGLIAGGVGVLATAALVFVVATHPGQHEAASSALSGGSGSNAAPALSAPKGAASISYPGVDTTTLSARGILLLPPAGHGISVLTAGQAQAVAGGSAGAYAGTSGPAILAFAELTDQTHPITCLCWVVDVPVRGGVTATPVAPSLRTELVLVDAVSGRIAAVLSGQGIP
ncbi:MAG TPA: hypothetical protein VIG86_01225 [Candidatus Dormibacteraeota bacterium]|jgi:hypothetical protein